jgi:hypothetical protein
MNSAPHTVPSVVPRCAVEGGRVTVEGEGLPVPGDRAPQVLVGGTRAAVASASSRRLRLVIPPGLEAGRAPITVEGREVASIEIGGALSGDLHLVDNPAIDAACNIYATFSGSRGQHVPVSIFRVRPNGAREPLVTDLVNATSLAFDRDGDLCVSSRFEGSVYRVRPDGGLDKIASELGVACGLAFSGDGSLFVGDRSGTLFRVNAAGRVTPFASLPPSVAAYHLAVGPDEAVYLSAPTLSSTDSVYRVDRRGEVSVFATGFGRPQGLAFDRHGRLHLVEALAGASGLYRLGPNGRRELVVAGAGLVGVAFHPERGLVLASGDTVFRVEADLA